MSRHATYHPSDRPALRKPDPPQRSRRAKKDRPTQAGTESGQKSGASLSQFRRHRLIEGLPRLGNRVDPEYQRSRFEQLGNSLSEARRFDCSKCVNSAGLRGSGMGEAAGSKNLRRPLFQRRPSDRRSVAPVRLRALPCRPGLFGTEVLVSVVHQGIEPALGSCPGETSCGDPLFQRFPNRKVDLFPGTRGTETAIRTVRFAEVALRFQ